MSYDYDPFDFERSSEKHIEIRLTSIEQCCQKVVAHSNFDPSDFLRLNIEINDSLGFLVEKKTEDAADMSVSDLRCYPVILEKSANIIRLLKKIMEPKEPEYPLEDLSFFTEWSLSKDAPRFDDYTGEWGCGQPTESESKIMECIGKYEKCSRDITKTLFPTFKSLAAKIIQEIELFRKSIDIDLFLEYIYDKRLDDKRLAKNIDDTDSLVAKANHSVNIGAKEYEVYFFKYLEHLKDVSEKHPSTESIYSAHVIHKPLSITDDEIKHYILFSDKLSESEFRQIIATIKKINYLKEKCGDIKPRVKEDTTLSDADKTLLKGILAYAAKVDWQGKATLEKANTFFEEIFKEQAFRDFFKKGRGKENARAEVAMAYVLGYLMQKQLIGGTQKNISKKVFGKDMSNSINKAYRDSDDARQAYKDLKPTLGEYRKKYF